MPWKKNSSRRLILQQLTTGRLVKNGYIGRYFRPISGQNFNIQNKRAAMGGGSVARGFSHYLVGSARLYERGSFSDFDSLRLAVTTSGAGTSETSLPACGARSCGSPSRRCLARRSRLPAKSCCSSNRACSRL